jgi:hypothetical protein
VNGHSLSAVIRCRRSKSRCQNKIKQARGTHVLSSVEGEASQDAEANRGREGHSPTIECGGRASHDTEENQSRATHELSSAERGTSRPEDTDSIRVIEGYSQTIEQRGRDMSGHRKKPASKGHSLPVKSRRRGSLGGLKEIERTRSTYRL